MLGEARTAELGKLNFIVFYATYEILNEPYY